VGHVACVRNEKPATDDFVHTPESYQNYFQSCIIDRPMSRLPSDRFPSGFPTKTLYTFLISPLFRSVSLMKFKVWAASKPPLLLGRHTQ
jgi:hypothetical protein